MTIAAERTWLMIAIELAKMQRDMRESKRHAVGIGAPRTALTKQGAPRTAQD